LGSFSVHVRRPRVGVVVSACIFRMSSDVSWSLNLMKLFPRQNDDRWATSGADHMSLIHLNHIIPPLVGAATAVTAIYRL